MAEEKKPEMMQRNKSTDRTGIVGKGIELFFKYKEVILYLVFGGLTTLVNIVCYAVCAKGFHMGTLVSNGIAWVLSVLFAYITNKLFVFESKTNNWREAMREFVSFIACRAGTGALDMGVMYVTVDILNWYDVLMKIVSNIIVIILNFVFSKLLIFQKKEENVKENVTKI